MTPMHFIFMWGYDGREKNKAMKYTYPNFYLGLTKNFKFLTSIISSFQ